MSLRLARVEEMITPQQDGRIFFESTYWNARFYDLGYKTTAFPGEKIQVVGRDGLTLLVMPVDFNSASTFYKVEN